MSRSVIETVLSQSVAPPDLLRKAALRAAWHRGRFFLLWLALFYTVWLTIVIIGNHFGTLREHWGIALAMALGSYVAGSTPMGGGTIGFPILVLLFGEHAHIGRNFSFAVQSIGMVSAAIFIIVMGRPIAWSILRWAMLGSLVGTPLGAAFIAPYADDLTTKLLFAILWASFGVIHLIKIREIVGLYGFVVGTKRFNRNAGLAIGFFGGMFIASITGVGIDLLLYIVMVLLIRADIRIAIPTSIILMAFTSLVGLASNLLLAQTGAAHYAIDPAVYANWLAAAPIVAVGAPFGALMVNVIPRAGTLILVSFLCIGQFIWTCSNESVGGLLLFFAILSVLTMNAIFMVMRRIGIRRAEQENLTAMSRRTAS